MTTNKKPANAAGLLTGWATRLIHIAVNQRRRVVDAGFFGVNRSHVARPHRRHRAMVISIIPQLH